jgi:hypothetical protein
MSLMPCKIVRRVKESLSYINKLDPTTKSIVIRSYEEAVHITLWFSVAVAASAMVISIFIREKPLAR